ncbi:MAG: DUF4416 family protein [Planctomycetes bacterium]|nr:DUF4416 family protein [Planctomycetota bacterium]
MAEVYLPHPVKLFVAVLAEQESHLDLVRETLGKEWGEIGLESETFPFDNSAYYAKVTGPAIVRKFFAFRKSVSPGVLAGCKKRTNEMEGELAAALGSGFPRPVNLDPGYLALEKVVLASAKNFSHRIYLDHGIYGEVTLIYRHEKFNTLEWTFPDYASGRYFPFFHGLRDELVRERDGNGG